MEKSRIFINKRGEWFQDGIKITHIWTYLENNKNLSQDSNGRFFVDDGMGKVYVEVEDTPFVVKMVKKVDNEFFIILNDRTEEKLNFEEFKMNKENIPYTKVKNSNYNARFLRPAYYELTKHAIEENGNYYIILNNKKIKIN